MATIVVDTEAKMQVKRLQRSINQAALLEVEHYIAVDDVAKLDIGDTLTYTDTELGLVFSGEIMTIKLNYKAGESVTYQATDFYRLISKSAAFLSTGSGNSYRLGVSQKFGNLTVATGGARIDYQTIEDYITLLLTAGGFTFDGASLGAIPDIGDDLDPLDRGGSSFDDWISELLSWSSQGFSFVDYPAGVPTLVFGEYGNNGSFDLEVSSLSSKAVITLDGDPVLVNGALTEKFAGRPATLILEGAGNFQRLGADNAADGPAYVVNLLDVEVLRSPRNPSLYNEIRFHVPSVPFLTGKLINRTTALEEDLITVRFLLTTGPWIVINSPAANLGAKDDYVFFDAGIALIPNVATFLNATMWVTAMNTPLTQSVAIAGGEGVEVQIEDDYYKYQDHLGVTHADFTADFVTLATQRARKFSTATNKGGALSLHVSGLNADIKLGASIGAPAAFADLIVSSISYDFQNRNMNISVSSKQLKQREKDQKQEAKVARGNLAKNWVFGSVADAPLGIFSGVRHFETGA